jgi:hypothetical protein
MNTAIRFILGAIQRLIIPSREAVNESAAFISCEASQPM